MAICLLFRGTIAAQQPPSTTPANAATTDAAPINEGLKIIILEGQDAVNDIRTAPMTETVVVEVRDQNDRPVENATVDFQLPLMGPSGGFEGGVRNKQVTTNVQGQASASFLPNMERGRFTIQVKATAGALTNTTTITQRNSTENEPAEKRGIGRHKKLIIILAAVAAGAIVGVVLATRGGSSSTGNGGGTVTITPGVPTVGGPQ
jgi:hypothetical protein